MSALLTLVSDRCTHDPITDMYSLFYLPGGGLAQGARILCQLARVEVTLAEQALALLALHRLEYMLHADWALEETYW